VKANRLTAKDAKNAENNRTPCFLIKKRSRLYFALFAFSAVKRNRY